MTIALDSVYVFCTGIVLFEKWIFICAAIKVEELDIAAKFDLERNVSTATWEWAEVRVPEKGTNKVSEYQVPCQLYAEYKKEQKAEQWLVVTLPKKWLSPPKRLTLLMGSICSVYVDAVIE